MWWRRLRYVLLLAALAKPDANVPFIMPERLARTDANTQIAEGVAYLILLLVLVIRPSGFFGKAES